MTSGISRQPSTRVSQPGPAASAAPPTIFDVLAQAEALRRGGQPGDALALCRAVLRQVPGHADALNLAGVAARQAGDDAAAVAFLRDAAAQAPDRADIRRNLGVLLHAMGRPKEAVIALERAVADDPGDAGLHFDLGNAQTAAGRAAEAARSLGRAVELAPERADVRTNWGSALAALGREAEAVAAFRGALAVDPVHLPALVNLGRLLRRSGAAAEAAAAFDQAAGLRPDDAALHCEWAASLADAGDAEAAAAAYGRAAALRPDDAEAHAGLGGVLAGLGHLDEAAASLRAALALRPGDGRILLSLGNVLRFAGDREGARDILRRAVLAAPRHAAAPAAASLHAAALAGLGAVLADLNDPRAEATLRRAIARDADSLEAHYALAGVLQRSGRAAAARDLYAEVLRIDPGNATARHLAAALGGDNPAEPPAGFVRDLFDGYAERFERHLVTELGYSMPATLRRLAAGLLPPGGAFARVRDLGCGTGLAGAAFRDLAGRLEGVDLSPRMLAEARAKNLYDALHLDDAVAHLRGLAGAPPDDLLIAADTVNYLGDLAPLFAAAAARLATGGLFAFSVERLDGDGFRLCPSGRYVHGEGYLRRLAAAHGFDVAVFEEADIRREAGAPERGMAWVLRHAGPA